MALGRIKVLPQHYRYEYLDVCSPSAFVQIRDVPLYKKEYLGRIWKFLSWTELPEPPVRGEFSMGSILRTYSLIA